MNEIVFVSPDAVRVLVDQDFNNAAERLNVPVASVRAVAEVESSGSGFLEDGRPTILYEAHIFHRETKGKHAGSKDRHGVSISSPKWDRSLYGRTGSHQYDRLNDAMALDVDAALKSCSWGAFQLMGFNHKICGYEDVRSMVESMVAGAAGQLEGFLGFVTSNKLEAHLRNLPQPAAAQAFARGFNGAGFAENQYDQKIINSFNRWSRGGGPPPPFVAPLRVGSRGDAVHKLQVRLGVPADSVFGPATADAVRAVQRSAKIMEDGIAGERTHGILGLPWPPLMENT